MGRKTEKTKEQKIKSELKRLNKIFEDLEENKKELVTPLIEKAAFMSIELNELQETLKSEGWTQEYKNGKDQYGEKKSANADVYTSLMKNYTTAIKQLIELVPASKKKESRLLALRGE